MDNLKVYEILIDEDSETGVNFISLVKDPAVQIDFLAFNAERSRLNFAIENEEERIVFGVIMLADTPIYRNNTLFGEHYVSFSKKTIKHIILKYFRDSKIDSINLNHKEVVEDGVYLFQSYIVDSKLGMDTPKAFSNIPDGSWIGAFKIDSDEVWSAIKAGEYKGFSIEGMFSYGNIIEEASLEEELIEIHKLLAQIK